MHTAAVRPGCRTSGPHQTAHSSTSPCHEVHCASAPAGIAACGNEGESLAPVAGTCRGEGLHLLPRRRDRVEREDPLRPARGRRRSPLTRRAGSSQTPTSGPPPPSGSDVLGAGARVTRPTASGAGSRRRSGPSRRRRRPLAPRGRARRTPSRRRRARTRGHGRAHAGGGIPVGVAGGDRQPGGLLEAVGGEEHAGREVPELVDRLGRRRDWVMAAATRSASKPPRAGSPGAGARSPRRRAAGTGAAPSPLPGEAVDHRGVHGRILAATGRAAAAPGWLGGARGAQAVHGRELTNSGTRLDRVLTPT